MMGNILKVGHRFTQPVPGTVIAVLDRGGVVTGYEVRLDGAPDGETWLVPLDALETDVAGSALTDEGAPRQ